MVLINLEQGGLDCFVMIQIVKLCEDLFVILQLEIENELLLFLDKAGQEFKAAMLSKSVNTSTNELLPAVQ